MYKQANILIAHYTCLTCQHFVVVESTKDGTFTEPRECTHCKGKLCMSLVHNKCDFADKQWIKVRISNDIYTIIHVISVQVLTYYSYKRPKMRYPKEKPLILSVYSLMMTWWMLQDQETRY